MSKLSTQLRVDLEVIQSIGHKGARGKNSLSNFDSAYKSIKQTLYYQHKQLLKLTNEQKFETVALQIKVNKIEKIFNKMDLSEITTIGITDEAYTIASRDQEDNICIQLLKIDEIINPIK